MNIPSIESLLSELDKYKRAYESADAQILSLKEQRNRLTAERDEAINCAKNNELYIVNLAAERDRFANMISESSNRWQEMMAALREAKEALSELHRVNLNNYMHDPDDYENTAQASMASKAITTINKVLGEE